ncbi:hypothetical protein LTR97_009154 [Elasticomyces elasticus]|uniref:Uncharacterized protein n=1 Tax=Elasticomyces elasticus TaxID=574655 RepID=A0AAN7ZZM9_9PEZI|nr:hypothetical protein LTR97_009154 [Elasticomyces elasticus]
MDTQPARERAVRIRTQPKHAPQTFRLMIDIQDNLPPRELVYRNDESGLDTAMAFVRKHKLDNDLTIPIWDAITKKTGGRLFGLVEMEDIVTAAPTTKPLPSSLQAESGEFVTAKPEPANESPSEALNVDETPLQSLIDDWRKTSERTRLGIPTPRQEVAAPAFDFRTRVARFRREINEAPVRKCTPSLIVSPFATPGVQPSHAHPRLATGASEVENDASERKLVHMSNTSEPSWTAHCWKFELTSPSAEDGSACWYPRDSILRIWTLARQHTGSLKTFKHFRRWWRSLSKRM